MSLEDYIKYRNDPWTRVVEYCAVGCILLCYAGFFLGIVKLSLWAVGKV